MEVQKVKLYELLDKEGQYYSDEFGFLKGPIKCLAQVRIMVKRSETDQTIEKEQSVSFKDLRVKDGKALKNVEIKDFLDSSKKKLYVLCQFGYGYYDRNNFYIVSSLGDRNIAIGEAKILKVIVEVNNKKMEFNSLQEMCDALSEKEAYVVTDRKDTPLRWYEIKQGDYVLFQNEEKYERNLTTYLVKEMHHRPNPSNLVCDLESPYNGTIVRVTDAMPIYRLPYKQYPIKNELAQFNQEIREIELAPLWESGISIVASNRCYYVGNLYWQPIEEAASYTVSLYKYKSDEMLDNKLYLLEEYVVDRNKHWLTINNLYETRYIVRLTAEDRKGNKIAVSRGIPVNFPSKLSVVQYWGLIDANMK